MAILRLDVGVTPILLMRSRLLGQLLEMGSSISQVSSISFVCAEFELFTSTFKHVTRVRILIITKGLYFSILSFDLFPSSILLN